MVFRLESTPQARVRQPYLATALHHVSLFSGYIQIIIATGRSSKNTVDFPHMLCQAAFSDPEEKQKRNPLIPSYTSCSSYTSSSSLQRSRAAEKEGAERGEAERGEAERGEAEKEGATREEA